MPIEYPKDNVLVGIQNNPPTEGIAPLYILIFSESCQGVLLGHAVAYNLLV